MKSIAIFCGSSLGARPEYRQTAEALGHALATRGISLVYGGARVGLMGAVADAALSAGGTVIGVLPEALTNKEIAHPNLTDLRIVASMHERKALMADLADAFIALPGGFGTFEEFCEAATWTQLGFQSKPCALLNVSGYYDPLLALFDRGVEEKFIRPEHRAGIVVDSEVDRLLEKLEAWSPTSIGKWIDK